ncbi:hypothetical protein L1765_14825 [Microaerobacter geothermalis]|uniref:hypothetical protein n=1 Tax=Microaerobacter geothermalis TaxID=674972 RepID=UPI001F30826E|nr:hypothetical protein [Microaerobacter geothermalis]MCF6095234.1 hypothetical protein [Microaerobacter geothermalis]
MKRTGLGITLMILIFVVILIAVGCSSTQEGAQQAPPPAEKQPETIVKEVIANYGPPVIPHTIEGRWGRDDKGQPTCLSCHQEGIGGAPKTPHPERDSCVQCHVPQADSREAFNQ